MTGVQVIPPENLPEPLTEREREILVCLANDLSNQEIANKLYLAEKTIRWYNSQIYSKLRVSNRHEAVAQAQALGLLSIPHVALGIVSGKHNLPVQITPFIGRLHELRDLSKLLNSHDTRLITILAPGGMGKTRLAIEAARTQLGRYADGVFFVPLAPLGSSNDIVTAIAENIGISFYGENPPMEQLINVLHDCAMLLVLDNFEHLLDGVDLIAGIIQSTSNVHLLTTSRTRLNLQGETVYTLRGMDFPTWETPTDALAYDAVKLFMQSAQRVRFDYELPTHDLDYLARICRLTEGMPLGIELAAGWIDVLSLDRIAAEIQQGIDILETEMRDVPERHRSLRATFESTWGRLTEEEQRVFMRLAVFRGGFTVEAAQAIAGADVRSMRRLANKALVQMSPDNRHDIHELLRQFGTEKLRLSGEESKVQVAHAAFFIDFMAARQPDIRTNRQLEALEMIDPDFENVRSTWLFIVNQRQWDQLLKVLYSLWFYLDMRSRGQEGVELLEFTVAALRSAPTSSATEHILGCVLTWLGWFYQDTGFFERSEITSNEGLRILRQHNNTEDLIPGLYSRALLALFQRQYDVTTTIAQEGLNIARSIGDPEWEMGFLMWLGWANVYQANLESALTCAENALQIAKALGNQSGLRGVNGLLGGIKDIQKNYDAATYRFQQALIQVEGFRHDFSIGELNTRLGRIAIERRNYAVAWMHLKKGLQTFWTGYKRVMLPYPLVYIARMLADQHEFDRAVEILATLQKHPLTFADTDVVVCQLRDQLEANLEPERFAAAWSRGEARELSAVVIELLADDASA